MDRNGFRKVEEGARPLSEAAPVRSAAAAMGSLVMLLALGVLSVSSVMGGEAKNESSDSSEVEALEEGEAANAPASSDPKVSCLERDVKVARTGKFDGAKLRATPGFEHPQAGIVTRGAHLVVCETTTTPGTKIPNVWYRIHEGKHEGLWIHKQVLAF